MHPLPKWLTGLLLLSLVAACTAAPASPTAAPATATLAPSPTQDAAATATAESHRLATALAATLTALPTATPPPTATDTRVPSPTTVPPSPTTKAVVATRVPATPVPPTSTQAPAGGSIYSFTGGGPQGYTSTLFCTQVGGVPCQASMPPGDLSFVIILESSADALEVIFVPFGLSVEKDGVNAANMYMTADAGWLPPASAARFGTSRTFGAPGHYVVRTNGCLFTLANYASGMCTWWTLNGTVVSFDIQ